MGIDSIERYLWNDVFSFLRSKLSGSSALRDCPDQSAYYMLEKDNNILVDCRGYESRLPKCYIRLALKTNPSGYAPCKTRVKDGCRFGWVNVSDKHCVLYYLISKYNDIEDTQEFKRFYSATLMCITDIHRIVEYFTEE